MSDNKKDIFEAKPGLYGFNIDLIALWRRFFSKKPVDPVFVVAYRIFEIFKMHGVAVSQIPRLIPELTLAQLKDTESLLPAITSDVIQKISDLFQVQRSWLEGNTNIIYDCRYSCYKNPWRFFEDLKTLKIDDMFDQPLIALTSSKNLNNTSEKDQPILLIQRERFAELDSKPIYRYRIIDQFLWGYFKTRVQLKAIIRIWYSRFEIPVNIYHVDKNILESIEKGMLVPDSFIRRNRQLRHVALEDFSLSPEESAKSKESAELPEVFEYINAYKLEKMEGDNPVNSENTAKYR